VPVAQVDEDDAAMIAPPLGPACTVITCPIDDSPTSPQ